MGIRARSTEGVRIRDLASSWKLIVRRHTLFHGWLCGVGRMCVTMLRMASFLEGRCLPAVGESDYMEVIACFLLTSDGDWDALVWTFLCFAAGPLKRTISDTCLNPGMFNKSRLKTVAFHAGEPLKVPAFKLFCR